MNEEKLVSVIIPAYNHESYIIQTLQSVIDQTYKNIELIVIDDGSKDGTYLRSIEFKNANKERNISVTTKPNEGVCKTLNMGIRLAHGNYICFLASDDYWRNDKIEKQILFMEENTNVGLVFSDAAFVYNTTESQDLWSEYKKGYQRYFTSGNSNSCLYTELMINLFIPSLTVMLRYETLQKVGVFDENLPYEDIDMWLRFSLETNIGYIDQPLAYYRMHNNNVSNNLRFMLYGYYLTIKKHFNLPSLKKRVFYKSVLVINICLHLIAKRIAKIFLKNGQ